MAMKSVQIVTFDGEITPNEAKVMLEASPLQNKEYHTVSIIGCQSTGKSTLLNLLFDTSFDTLDAIKGRNQTTRGIHLACNAACKCLVVDIEGTDSQVRGDDGAAFEQKSALFALAISDVLMVNMWTSEIGRYKAASVGLLKTIFEVNLKLFGQEGKKRILFVLRDFNDATNTLTILKQQISKTMEEIWDKIKKPSNLALCNVFDCFEFDFHTVAVKDFKPEEFTANIMALKDKFMNDERHDYLFRYKNTDVPVDGISLYYSEIWNIITSDKDLNIPSQKEMLASMRCNELKLEAIKEFHEFIMPISKQIGKVVVTGLGLKFEEGFDLSLKVYDEHASGYYEVTYKKIREDLVVMLQDQAKDLFHAQLKLIVTSSFQKAKEMFTAKLPKNAAVDNFSEIANEIISAVKDEFYSLSRQSIVSNSDWQTEDYENELERFFYEKIVDEKEKQLSLLDKEVSSSFDGKFNAEISKILENSMELNVWEKLQMLQGRTMGPLEQRMERALSSLERNTDEVGVFIASMRVKCLEVIRAKLDKFIKNLEEFMTKKFSTLFNKDEKGVPRDPKRTNYEEVFSSSKSRVLPVLDQFKYFLLSPDWEKSETESSHGELLTEEMFEKILEGFLKDAERTYKDALHIKEFGYNRGGLPKWAIAMMAVLGWNEILWVLGSPFILYPSMFIGSIVALMFSMGLGAVPKLIFSQVLNKIPFLS